MRYGLVNKSITILRCSKCEYISKAFEHVKDLTQEELDYTHKIEKESGEKNDKCKIARRNERR